MLQYEVLVMQLMLQQLRTIELKESIRIDWGSHTVTVMLELERLCISLINLVFGIV